MNGSYSESDVQGYLAKVKGDIERESVDPVTFGNDFSFHQARIDRMEFDLSRENLTMEISCIDWLRENTGTPNPYLPHKLVFRDMVQFYYRNREKRSQPRIFQLNILTISDMLIEAKDLYAYREESGLKPIALDVQMPLEDSELIILCSEVEVHVGDRVVTVAP